MFREPDLDVDQILNCLAIEKIQYDHTGTIIGEFLDEDFFSEFSYESLLMVAEEFTGSYIEETDQVVHKMLFPYMRLFYDLCREYSRINRIGFKKNPHVQNALGFVNEELSGIYDYDFEWLLCTPKKDTRKKQCALILFIGMEFYSFVQLLEALYNIRDYYHRAASTLLIEIYGKKGLVPKDSIDRRAA